MDEDLKDVMGSDCPREHWDMNPRFILMFVISATDEAGFNEACALIPNHAAMMKFELSA